MKYFFSFLSILTVVAAIVYLASKHFDKICAKVGKKYVVVEDEPIIAE